MGEKIDLGTSLRRTREKAGWTGEAVAKKLNLSPAAYRRYERNEVDPGASTILKLAEIYDCSVDVLCKHGGEGGEQQNFNVNVGDKAGAFHITITGSIAEAAKTKKSGRYDPPVTMKNSKANKASRKVRKS